MPILKPVGPTSFGIIEKLRKITKIRKIGHAGTLDPFASGVLLCFIGPKYTKQASKYVGHDKEYVTEVKLGQVTDTYDVEGTIQRESDLVPTEEQIDTILAKYQGEIMQVPPMHSAKKIAGQRLYELARQGIEVERQARPVRVVIEKLGYEYPILKLRIECSSGTYIRSLGYDIGEDLG